MLYIEGHTYAVTREGVHKETGKVYSSVRQEGCREGLCEEGAEIYNERLSSTAERKQPVREIQTQEYLSFFRRHDRNTVHWYVLEGAAYAYARNTKTLL